MVNEVSMPSLTLFVFLHGTTLMHQTGLGVTREERVNQVLKKEKSVTDFMSYVPIGDAVHKLNIWHQQGAKICYLSSHRKEQEIEKDKQVLIKYAFPKGEIFFRRTGKNYIDIIAEQKPEIVMEYIF